MHNGKYNTKSYKQKQAAKVDKQYGPIMEHTKNCIRCGNEYTFVGRKQTKKYEKSRFCKNAKCTHSRQEYWNKNATAYRTICYQHWPKECAICKFDKVVAVHHIDENKANNDKHNLIPLCPNHHEMVHSKWRNEVQPLIDVAVKKRLGD